MKKYNTILQDKRVLLATLASLLLATVLLSQNQQSFAPYLPDRSTGYTLLAIAAAALGLWLIWQNTTGRSNGQLSNAVVTFTGVAGLAIASCSFILSVAYGYTMGGNNAFLPVVFAIIFGAISVAEFTAAYWLEHWLNQRNAPMFMVASILMVIGVFTSILAGQALIASQIDDLKAERLQASDAYKSHQHQLDNAQQRVQNLSVSEHDYQNAQANIANLTQQANDLIAGNRQYANCTHFPQDLCTANGAYYTKTNQLNNELGSLRNQLLSNQQRIDQYNDYQGALSHLNTLENKALPAAVNADLPHIKWLAAVTHLDADLIEARLYISLAIIAELVGLVLLYFYGKGTRQDESLPIANVSLNQVPAMSCGGLINSDGLVYLHAGERVLTQAETDAYHAWLATNVSPTNVDHERNATNVSTNVAKTKKGQTATCPTCGTQFTRKNHWHVYCQEDCRIKGNGFKNKAEMLAKKSP